MTESRIGHPTTVGHVVAGVFGLVFLIVNSGLLSTPVRWLLGGVATVALAVVVLAFVATERDRVRAGRAPYGTLSRRYWTVVAVEVVLLFGGLQVLARVWPSAGVAWIAVVVGVHFFPLARLWPEGRRQLTAIAVVMTLLGLAGLGLAFATADGPLVALVVGIGCGLALLGSATGNAVLTLRRGRRAH